MVAPLGHFSRRGSEHRVGFDSVGEPGFISCNDPLKAFLCTVGEDGQQTWRFHHSSQFLVDRLDMGHPSACEFSQTQFPISNSLDGDRSAEKCPAITQALAKGKLLQKALKSRAQRNQRSSRPFFVAAGKVAGFESPEPTLDGGQ
jgi:hypothetical protein